MYKIVIWLFAVFSATPFSILEAKAFSDFDYSAEGEKVTEVPLSFPATAVPSPVLPTKKLVGTNLKELFKEKKDREIIYKECRIKKLTAPPYGFSITCKKKS